MGTRSFVTFLVGRARAPDGPSGQSVNVGVSRNPSKWLVYNEKFYENPMEMDDLGVPNFGKAPYEKSTPQPRDLFFSVAQGAGRLHCWFLRFYPPGVNHG